MAITVFPEDVYRAPETWARRAYRNLAYFKEVDKGGHFAAWEEPDLCQRTARRLQITQVGELSAGLQFDTGGWGRSQAIRRRRRREAGLARPRSAFRSRAAESWTVRSPSRGTACLPALARQPRASPAVLKARRDRFSSDAFTKTHDVEFLRQVSTSVTTPMRPFRRILAQSASSIRPWYRFLAGSALGRLSIPSSDKSALPICVSCARGHFT